MKRRRKEHAEKLKQMEAEGADKAEMDKMKEEQEQEIAAIKMQNMFRQREAARAVDQKRAERKERDEKDRVLREQKEQEIAAVKLQSVFRGRKERRALDEKKAEIEAERAARAEKDAADLAAIAAGGDDAGEWIEYWDDENQAYYYFNTLTQEARWTRPGDEEGYGTGGTITDYGTDNYDPNYQWEEEQYEGGYYDEQGEWVWTDETAKAAALKNYCVECETAEASRWCDDCEDFYCDACYEMGHAKGSRQSHTWRPIFVDEDGDGIDDRLQGAEDVAYNTDGTAVWESSGYDTGEAVDEWIEYFDETYQMNYYYNPSTQETVWEKPAGMA